jgi:hypothetical protein
MGNMISRAAGHPIVACDIESGAVVDGGQLGVHLPQQSGSAAAVGAVVVAPQPTSP